MAGWAVSQGNQTRGFFEIPPQNAARAIQERKMKKILFVIYSLGYGGAERSLVNLLQELPQEDYQIDLLLFR